MSALPRAANSGRWSATWSMNDSLPSSTRVHTAAEVSTLVCENSRNSVSLVAASCRPVARVAVGAEQRQLAVPGQRDLGAGIAALLDMPADQQHRARRAGGARSRGWRDRSRATGKRWAWRGSFLRVAPMLGRTARLSHRGRRRTRFAGVAAEGAMMTDDAITLCPIGTITTPFHTLDACPRNGRQPDPPPVCRVRLLAEFAPGLRSLDGFTHLILLYWLHRGRGQSSCSPRPSIPRNAACSPPAPRAGRTRSGFRWSRSTGSTGRTRCWSATSIAWTAHRCST